METTHDTRSGGRRRPGGKTSRGNRGEGTPSQSRPSPFLDALEGNETVRAVELRPPRVGLDRRDSLEAWIDLEQGVRRLLARDRFVLFTDDAVGDREEESLRVLTDSLGPGADLSQVVPFLTCKHSLEYCTLFARRAQARGLGGLTVTGGDRSVGPPRCLPRSRDLRATLRDRLPALPLGAWVNPFRDPDGQAALLGETEHHAAYFLTQVVSHHDMDGLDRFRDAMEARDIRSPGLVGVFYYRSPNRKTLEHLSRFLPVPMEGLVREFEAGASPQEICARTLRALEARGVRKVYICNLKVEEAAQRLQEVEALL